PERIAALNRELGPAWEKYWNTIYGKEIAEAGSARNVALPADRPFIDEGGRPLLFVSDEHAVRTRLGAEGARIRFTEGVIGPFGQEISGLTLPSHWSRNLTVPEEAVTPESEDGKLGFALGETRFVYAREGLERVNS